MASGPQSGSHLAQITIELLEGEKRDVTATQLGNLWRQKVGIVPDAESITYQSVLFSAGNAVEVHMSLDDHDLLEAAAEELKAELTTYPGVFDVSDSFLPGKDEMQLKLKLAARSLGLTLDDLAKQVRHAFYGAEALRLQRDQDEVKVMVRYPESKRKSLGSIEDMYIRTPDGSEVPFNQVAEVKMEEGYAAIERAQRFRVIKVTANAETETALSGLALHHGRRRKGTEGVPGRYYQWLCYRSFPDLRSVGHSVQVLLAALCGHVGHSFRHRGRCVRTLAHGS
jgi:multidrug efflux pump subunit AcrB